ncbi:MAG: hypothetical protein IPJ16_08855 [Bacteroidales bacterium]|nr:hypothetical protein [Bacteroidales bacterium]
MMTTIKGFFVAFIFFLLNANFIMGQTNKLSGQTAQELTKQMKFQTEIILNNETGVQEKIIPLKDSLNSITIMSYSLIQTGSLTLEIFDPSGERQVKYSIKCPSKNNARVNKYKNIDNNLKGLDENKAASGDLIRTIINPIKGDWKAKIYSDNTSGVIYIFLTDKIDSANSARKVYVKIKL